MNWMHWGGKNNRSQRNTRVILPCCCCCEWFVYPARPARVRLKLSFLALLLDDKTSKASKCQDTGCVWMQRHGCLAQQKDVIGPRFGPIETPTAAAWPGGECSKTRREQPSKRMDGFPVDLLRTCWKLAVLSTSLLTLAFKIPLCNDLLCPCVRSKG